MNTAHVAEHYTAYLEGSLPEPLRQEVARHLDACPQCAAELEEMRRLAACLREMPAAPLPPDFAAGVHARLAARRPARPWLLRLPALAGGTLAAAVLALVIIYVQPRLTTPVSPTVANAPIRAEEQISKAAPGTGERETGSLNGLRSPAPAGAAPNAPGVAADPFAERGVAHQKTAAPTPPAITRTAKSGNTRGAQGGGSSNAPFRSRAQQMDRTGEKPASGSVTVNNDIDDKYASQQKMVAALPTAKPEAVREAQPPAVAVENKMTAEGSNVTPSIMVPAPETPGTSGPPGSAGPPRAFNPNEPRTNNMAADSNATPPLPAGSSGALNDVAKIENTNIGKTANPPGGPPREQAPAAAVPGARAGSEKEELQFSTMGKLTLRGITEKGADATVTVETAAAPAALTIRRAYLDRRDAQDVPLLSETHTAVFTIPLRRGGSVLELSLGAGDKAVQAYLVAPDAGERRAVVSLRLQKAPMTDALRQLAAAGHLFILCPPQFAQLQNVSFIVRRVQPLSALSDLAFQHGYRAVTVKNFVSLVPKAQLH